MVHILINLSSYVLFINIIENLLILQMFTLQFYIFAIYISFLI